MTEQEIRALLAAAMAYDNRRPGEAGVLAWLEASRRGRWTFDAALEALHAHYAESIEWVMPAHITSRLRSARSSPAPTSELHALTAGDPALPDRISSIVDAVAARLGWQRRQARFDPDLAKPCPYCLAAPNRPCTRRITRGPRRGQLVPIATPHPSRRGAA